VARYAGSEEMLCKVEEAIRAIQNTEEAVAHGMAAARILECIIMEGCSPVEAVEKCLISLRDPRRKFSNDMDRAILVYLKKVIEMKDLPHWEVVATLGKA